MLAAVPALTAAATPRSAEPCQVGQSTTWQMPQLGLGQRVKILTPVFVLACGSTGAVHAGSLEILGFDSNEGLCTPIRFGLPDRSYFSEGCSQPDGISHSIRRGPLQIAGFGWSEGSGRASSWSKISGTIDPRVADVEVRFHRDGQIDVIRAAVAQVSGELLAKLNQTDPFGLFAAVLPGCVPPHSVRAVARNGGGEFLGAQWGRSFPRFCARFGNANSQ
jgi:hypothetical protein